MRLHDVVATSDIVRHTRSRNDKIAAFAGFLAATPVGQVGVVVSWLSGLMPQGRIGVGNAALQKSGGIPPAAEPSIEVGELHEIFSAIAAVNGAGSVKRRQDLLNDVMARCTLAEQRFVRHLLFGELRQGAQEGVMIEGIAKATGIRSPIVRRALMLSGDITRTAVIAATEGAEALAGIRIELFSPLQPMLAHTAADPAEAIAKLGVAFYDTKIDGARVQVHRRGDEIHIYSRHLNEVTPAIPEVVELVAALQVNDIVLDGDAICLKPDGRPHNFQTTMRRFGRRLDVSKLRATLPIQPFFFDILQLDGEMLIDLPLSERLAIMDRLLPSEALIPRIETDDVTVADAFLARAIEAGHEGVMAKGPDSTYAAGSRGKSWLKIKHTHTLDLVVLAVEWGSGRREGWLSNLHLGALDPATGDFVMLGKTFKGLTDDLLKWQTEQLLAREVHRKGHVVFVRPELVVEIAFNEIQTSPRYPAGLALRFARVKAYRPDKNPDQADTIQTVQEIHARTAE